MLRLRVQIPDRVFGRILRPNLDDVDYWWSTLRLSFNPCSDCWMPSFVNTKVEYKELMRDYHNSTAYQQWLEAKGRGTILLPSLIRLLVIHRSFSIDTLHSKKWECSLSLCQFGIWLSVQHFALQSFRRILLLAITHDFSPLRCTPGLNPLFWQARRSTNVTDLIIPLPSITQAAVASSVHTFYASLSISGECFIFPFQLQANL